VSTASPAIPPSTRLGSAGSNPAFATTHWSVVLLAGRNDTARARLALEKLCRTYWYPLYAYVRRRGHSPHDAQDLTQDFFAHLLEHQAIAKADPARGRFRSFMLAAMKNFLAGAHEHACAQKRGGGLPLFSLDLALAEQRFEQEPADISAPDKLFDRQWALALLDGVLARLEAEYRAENKGELFAALKDTLTGARATQPYAELAVRLGLSEGAVKVTVHRLRQRYRALLQAEIAQTVATPADADAEMRHLLDCLRLG
jgi:RNA polymerase sigma factor (sigma-70 family)